MGILSEIKYRIVTEKTFLRVIAGINQIEEDITSGSSSDQQVLDSPPGPHPGFPPLAPVSDAGDTRE